MYIKTFENFNFFKNTSSYISNLKIHSICEKYGIRDYTINPDGSIDVDGDVNLYKKGLIKIPLKFGEVNGNFICSNNNLTSLEGSPERVGGYFMCNNNKLTTLEFSPKRVGRDFSCSYNDIWTFEDFNTSIGGNFYCHDNPIYEIWKLFRNTEKFDLFNEIDAIRPGKVIILDRLNEFLIMIGKEPIQKIDGYKCI